MRYLKRVTNPRNEQFIDMVRLRMWHDSSRTTERAGEAHMAMLPLERITSDSRAVSLLVSCSANEIHAKDVVCVDLVTDATRFMHLTAGAHASRTLAGSSRLRGFRTLSDFLTWTPDPDPSQVPYTPPHVGTCTASSGGRVGSPLNICMGSACTSRLGFDVVQCF